MELAQTVTSNPGQFIYLKVYVYTTTLKHFLKTNINRNYKEKRSNCKDITNHEHDKH